MAVIGQKGMKKHSFQFLLFEIDKQAWASDVLNDLESYALLTINLFSLLSPYKDPILCRNRTPYLPFL